MAPFHDSVVHLHSPSVWQGVRCAARVGCHCIAITAHPSRLHALCQSMHWFVDQQLASAANLTTYTEHERLVVLLLDEMHVRDDLVYDKYTGTLKGHQLFDPFWEAVSQLERLGFRVSYFSLTTYCNTYMNLLNSCLHTIIRPRFAYVQVLAATFDGASTNRRLVRMHDPTNPLVYKARNPFATDERELFFFSDPPHLIKTTRNCWASGC